MATEMPKGTTSAILAAQQVLLATDPSPADYRDDTLWP